MQEYPSDFLVVILHRILCRLRSLRFLSLCLMLSTISTLRYMSHVLTSESRRVCT